MLGQAEEPGLGIGDAHLGGGGDVGDARRPRNLHRQRLFVEPLAIAGLARLRGLEFGQLLAHPGAFGLEQTAVQIADHAFEGLLDRVALAPVLEGERDGATLGAEQDDLADFLVEILPRCLEAELVFLGEAGEHLHVIGRWRVGFGPRHHRPLLEGQRLVGDDQLGIEQLLLADPVAGRAGTLRRVKAEQARLDLLDGETADRTGEFFGKDDAIGGQASALHRAATLTFILAPRHHAIGKVDIGQPVGEAQGLFETVGKARFDAFLHRQAIDHDFDIVLELLVERGCFFDRVHLAVDPHAGEPGLLPFGELAAVFTLAPAYHRGEQIEPRAFGQGHHAINHVRHRLRLDREAGGGRIGHADTRPQQAHVIVDLGHGRHGRARIAARRLLFDRNRRRQPVDMFDIGLLHHFEELPRIGAQRFHIAPLPLRIDRIEGEAGLARARKPGDHDQRIARQIDVHALEIVFARTAHGDFGKSHESGVFRKCSLSSRRGLARVENLNGRAARIGPIWVGSR